jgi:xanthine dehydrogenase large subunit
MTSKAVGQNIPHDSSPGHVTGRSVFIDDRPFRDGEVLVDYVGSPVARGRLNGVDCGAASDVPGVVGVFFAKDIAHNLWGSLAQHEPVLVESEISHVGQAIVVVAAKTREALNEAKKRVRFDIEELPPVLTIADAKERGDFLSLPQTIARGDAEAALKRADHVLEGTFFSEGQEQFYLESQAAIAYPGESGEIEIHSSTQHPTEVQHVVAEALGLPFHAVTCVVKRMGGGFGGKETQAAPFAVMAALVARKTGRPARIVISKDDDMITTGKRHPFETSYRAGFDKEGRITALDSRLFSDGGAFADLSLPVLERAMLHSDNAYFLPNARIEGRVCRTNRHSNTAFRGFGGPQGAAVIENLMEEIAIELNEDAYVIRRRNCYEGALNVTPYGQTVDHNTLPEIFDRLYETSDYKRRRDGILEFNRGSKTRLRGISMTAVKFGIAFTTRLLNQGNALINVHRDGTVQVSTGATEMGQGVNTKIRQVVAHAFGLDCVNVVVRPTSTEKNSNTSPTAASSGADINCAAALVACDKIKARLRRAAAAIFSGKTREEDYEAQEDVETIRFEDGRAFDAARPEHKISFADLVVRSYLWRVALQDFGHYKTPDILIDKTTWQGRPFLYYTNGAAVSEVEIDRFTGDLKVRRTDILMDLGTPINPGIDRGQTTGAFIQGMGWVTTEKLVYDAKGTLLSHSPTTYKIPNVQDTPRVFNVNFLDARNPLNAQGSKAVGEPPLLLGISVWTAVKMALACAKPGWIPKIRIPATLEEILTALEDAHGS